MNPEPDEDLLACVLVPLLTDLINGRWLPIVGAGLSRNAELPGSGSIPGWKELGDRFGDELPRGYAADSPVETLSAYEHAYGRNKLVETVQRQVTDVAEINQSLCIGA